MTFVDYYELLGVSPPNPDMQVMRHNYRQLLMDHHPDKCMAALNSARTRHEKQQAQAKYDEAEAFTLTLKDAYETLHDDQRRAGYDADYYAWLDSLDLPLVSGNHLTPVWDLGDVPFGKTLTKIFYVQDQGWNLGSFNAYWTHLHPSIEGICLNKDFPLKIQIKVDANAFGGGMHFYGLILCFDGAEYPVDIGFNVIEPVNEEEQSEPEPVCSTPPPTLWRRLVKVFAFLLALALICGCIIPPLVSARADNQPACAANGEQSRYIRLSGPFDAITINKRFYFYKTMQVSPDGRMAAFVDAIGFVYAFPLDKFSDIRYLGQGQDASWTDSNHLTFTDHRQGLTCTVNF